MDTRPGTLTGFICACSAIFVFKNKRKETFGEFLFSLTLFSFVWITLFYNQHTSST